MSEQDTNRTEAFIRLLAEHERKLGMYTMMLISNAHDADEVLQEAKVVMWRSFEQFELGTNFAAWSRKVVFHQVLKYRRQPSRRVQLLSDGTLEALAVDVETMEGQLDERRTALAGCISNLRAEHREILGLRYNDGQSIDKIAGQVDRTTGAVYRVLSRIRRILHECVSSSMRLETE